MKQKLLLKELRKKEIKKKVDKYLTFLIDIYKDKKIYTYFEVLFGKMILYLIKFIKILIKKYFYFFKTNKLFLFNRLNCYKLNF